MNKWLFSSIFNLTKIFECSNTVWVNTIIRYPVSRTVGGKNIYHECDGKNLEPSGAALT